MPTLNFFPKNYRGINLPDLSQLLVNLQISTLSLVVMLYLMLSKTIKVIEDILIGMLQAGGNSQPSSPARTPRVYASVAEMKRSKGKVSQLSLCFRKTQTI